jgi:biotin operon repressor
VDLLRCFGRGAAVMSVQAVKWVRDLRGLNTSQKAVLFVIAEHADKNGSNSFPNLNTIAAESGCSRANLDRVLKQLKKDGLVEVTPRRGHRGRQTSSHYQLPLQNLISEIPEPHCEFPEPHHGGGLNKPSVEPPEKESSSAQAQNKKKYFKKTSEEIREKLTLKEIRSAAKSRANNCTLSLSWLWEQLYLSRYGETCSLTVKEKAQLKAQYKKHGWDAAEAVLACMTDWINFTIKAESEQQAYEGGTRPAVWFFVRHMTIALAMPQKPVQAHQKPQKPAPLFLVVPNPTPQPKTSNAQALKSKYGL